MHWNIDIVITNIKDKQEFDILRLKLYSHHSITKAELPTELHEKHTRKDELKDVRYKGMDCSATVFSDDERKGLEIYINRLEKEYPHIHFDLFDLPVRDKFKKVSKESSVAAAIVFIIIFSHEYIVTLAHYEYIGLENLFVILGFSFAGALATFWIDSLIIYKDKFGGIGFKKVSKVSKVSKEK